jgi:TonB family protein
VDRAVRLLHSARVQVPTVIGWLRPVVLIPASCLSGFSSEQVEAILCHELAHVRRHDYLVSIFQSVAEALLFYHPAVWWVSKQVRRERECCCDAIAVANGGDALAYAKALSHLEERRASFPEFVLGANGGVLKMRIRRLLGCAEDAPSQVTALTLLAVVLAMLGFYVAAVAEVQAQPQTNVPANGLRFAGTARQEVGTEAPKSAASVTVPHAADPVRKPQAEVSRHAPSMNSAIAMVEPPPTAPEDAPASRPAGPIRVSAGVMAGALATRVNPVYPPEAKTQGIQGTVVLHALISKEGQVESLQVISGPPALTASAIDAVRQWQYKPYLLNGEPTEVESTININYTLGGANVVAPGVMQGNLISQVRPVYPLDAKAARIQGVVTLRAVVSKQGDVKSLVVVSGPPELTTSALDAVKQWKYKPYLLNGQPTEVETTINVNYSLGESASAMPPPQETAAEAAPPATTMSDGATPPKLIYSVEPEYTPEAKAAKKMGTVLVNLIVDAQGEPENVHVVRGLGKDGNGLDAKAVEAVRRYRFKPAMRDDQPVATSINVEVNFRIF